MKIDDDIYCIFTRRENKYIETNDVNITSLVTKDVLAIFTDGVDGFLYEYDAIYILTLLWLYDHYQEKFELLPNDQDGATFFCDIRDRVEELRYALQGGNKDNLHIGDYWVKRVSRTTLFDMYIEGSECRIYDGDKVITMRKSNLDPRCISSAQYLK